MSSFVFVTADMNEPMRSMFGCIRGVHVKNYSNRQPIGWESDPWSFPQASKSILDCPETFRLQTKAFPGGLHLDPSRPFARSKGMGCSF